MDLYIELYSEKNFQIDYQTWNFMKMKTPKMIITSKDSIWTKTEAIFVFLNWSYALDIDFESISFYCSFKVKH